MLCEKGSSLVLTHVSWSTGHPIVLPSREKVVGWTRGSVSAILCEPQVMILVDTLRESTLLSTFHVRGGISGNRNQLRTFYGVVFFKLKRSPAFCISFVNFSEILTISRFCRPRVSRTEKISSLSAFLFGINPIFFALHMMSAK